MKSCSARSIAPASSPCRSDRRYLRVAIAVGTVTYGPGETYGPSCKAEQSLHQKNWSVVLGYEADPFPGAVMSIPSIRAAKSNRLLSALPRASLERLMPDLVLRPLQLRQVLQARGVPVEHVIFPLDGVAS